MAMLNNQRVSFKTRLDPFGISGQPLPRQAAVEVRPAAQLFRLPLLPNFRTMTGVWE